MVRYFFHLNALYEHTLDRHGAVFADLAQATSEAGACMRSIAAKALSARTAMDVLSIRICGDDGVLVDEVFIEDALSQMVAAGIIGRLLTGKRETAGSL